VTSGDRAVVRNNAHAEPRLRLASAYTGASDWSGRRPPTELQSSVEGVGVLETFPLGYAAEGVWFSLATGMTATALMVSTRLFRRIGLPATVESAV